MKHIGDLFAQYKKRIKPPQASVVKVFVEVCKEVTGIEIKPEQCSFTVSSGTIFLQVHSLIKSEVSQQKPQILTELKRRLGTSAPTTIL